MLHLHPMTLKEARHFVNEHHRHHKAPPGGLFAIGCSVAGEESPCAVVIVGRPVSRVLDDGWTAEVTRLCTLGERNACSMLYRAAWRAAKALGYRKLITYTLASESGASLIASGASVVGEVKGRSWHCQSRPRVDTHPLQDKFRWEFS